jgi:PAS domain S-box-containing protein
VAHAGHEDDGYLDTIQMTWGDAEQGRTPIGTAIRTGTPCLVRETTTDSCLTSWQEEAHRRGYLSSVALPLAADGVTFGALAIYAAEPAAFTVDEMELFQELAANLAYGIVALRTREERKKAEEALRQSAERYRSLVENVDLGITLIDGSYNVLMVNSAVGHMMAKPVGELLHKECFREFEKRTARCPYCPGATAMATGKPARVQTEGVRDDGSHFVAKITAFPVFDSNGKATQFIEVIQNITDQITVENEKKHLQEQLRQSQKFEAIGTLAGGIAHDFNNFLTVITAYCTLIGRKTTEDDPLRNYLNKMLTATEKAALLTQSLLAYSRKQAIDLRPVDIKEIIHKSHNLLARLLREDIELTVRTADEDLTIMADSLQIEQVLMNLATNARDAMPGGGILRITAELLEMGDEFVKSHGYGTPGRYALLAVADSGNGMDETTRERIFEPFFTTKEVGKGTGLGLSMAFGIIKQHNGYIDVYSEPGKGTTFRIFLPLTDSVQAERKQAESIRHEGGNETILLVEDDSAIRASLKELLEEVGYTIIEAMDGEDGILKFTEYEREIQLLLLDVIMPKKNGKEVYEEIRALRPDIKAVFVSGYTADILTAKGVLQDDLTLISKPVTIEALSVKIREMLDT